MTELLTVHHNNHNDKNVDNAELSQAQELYNNVVQTTYGYVCLYVCTVFLWARVMRCRDIYDYI